MLKNMLSIKKCREILGKKYEHLSDEQIEAIRDWCSNYVDLTWKIHERMLNAEKEGKSQKDSNQL